MDDVKLIHTQMNRLTLHNSGSEQPVTRRKRPRKPKKDQAANGDETKDKGLEGKELEDKEPQHNETKDMDTKDEKTKDGKTNKKTTKDKKTKEEKPEEKKPEEKKPREKKPKDKKPMEKKPNEKKPNEKKPNEKKPNEKKPNDKKPKEKKANEKEPKETKAGRTKTQETGTPPPSIDTGRFVRDPHSAFPLAHGQPQPRPSAPLPRSIPRASQTSQRLPEGFFQPSPSVLCAEIASFVPRQNQQTKPYDFDAHAVSCRIPRPTPTSDYTFRCLNPHTRLASPRRLLVVLDLNGVLVFRKRGLSHKRRPDLAPFLDYLFANHLVMIWSSGMRVNVAAIVERVMSPEHRSQLAAIWARDTLRIPSRLYGEKVQVYKQLSWIWEDQTLQSRAADCGEEAWDQSNTVLIDDSREKAASEPSNLICVDEFINTPEQQEKHTLLDVAAYLEQVRWSADVSVAMREMPFVMPAS